MTGDDLQGRDNSPREIFEVYWMFAADRVNDLPVDCFILVNREIAEPDCAFHACCGLVTEHASLA